MRLLLDTHAFLWWRADAPELGTVARAAIQDEANAIYVSAVVGWEINLKRELGKLVFEGSIDAAVAEEGFEELPVTLRHTDALNSLPLLHRDPFDRLLVAQARVEGLTMVTADPEILAYGGPTLKCGRASKHGRRRR